MKIATLSSNLLARKGAAQPSPAAAQTPNLTPVRGAPQTHERAGGARVRISLRLDPARHRRLRLAAVHLDRPLQDLLVAAIDQYLDQLDLSCACVKQSIRPCRGAAHQYEEDKAS